MDLREEMEQARPGDVPGPDVRAVLKLACAYQALQEGPDYTSTSWENQVQAQEFFDRHGLDKTLDKAFRLESLVDEDQWVPLLWRKAKVGQEVHLRGTHKGFFRAYGAHVVVDVDRRQLRNTKGTVFTHIAQHLLVRKES